MYAVLDCALTTDKGKALLCKHHPLGDTQTVYAEFKEYIETSNATTQDLEHTLNYLITTHAGSIA